MNFPSKNILFFFIIMAILLTITYLSNQLLISETLYYNTFAEQLTAEKIDGLIEQAQKWSWLGYVIIPIIYFFKFSFIVLTLLIGFFFINQKVSFSVLFKAVMLAELPFLLVPFIKLFWFLFIQTQYDFNDLQYFYPLSALQLFEVKNLPTWQIYPLQLLNIFELVYWILLAYWFKRLLNITLTKGMKIVVASYGTGLLLWVVFVTFLSLNAT
ncbi:hypothetical protein [Emticicia sp. W12TSBA100-4]|uniref:hypothetical protein n=1 Tax=Emticicia sp. W12TSBA100-4 TaxID=3160965 RepID=UPI00330618E1